LKSGFLALYRPNGHLAIRDKAIYNNVAEAMPTLWNLVLIRYKRAVAGRLELDSV
jgi:hypothetical protein